MPPYSIGPYPFRTKGEAEQEVRRILHESPMREPLRGYEHDLIRCLVDLHHDAAEKIGPGVKSIYVNVVEYGSRGFWIERTDATVIDFSYKRALRKPTARADAAAAMRREIMPQVAEFLASAFAESDTIACPLTGQHLRRTDGHVDHVIPFASVAHDFLMHRGMSWDDVRVRGNAIGCELSDRDLAHDWQEWHRSKAVLRFIHASANLRRSA